MEEKGEPKEKLENVELPTKPSAVSETKRRVFLALDPDPATQEFLEHERRVLLSKAWGKRSRFVEIADFHLTLHFCGDQSAEVIEKLVALSEDLVKGKAQIDIPIASASLFPRASRARALVCLGKSEPELKALVRETLAGCSALGIDAPRHPFRPHFTIARLKENNRLPNLKNPKDRQATLRAGSLSLYASSQGNGGTSYEKLASFPFGQDQPAPSLV